MSDNDLGAFLRARREALKPDELGLPGSGRRRTPGLRRSELATVAGVSVEYLTRLEQGRDRNPSVQVLVSLADALRLAPEERLHLRHLAKLTSGSIALCPNGGLAPARTVRPTVRMLLDRLEPTPAVVVNRLGEVLAHTMGFERLAGPIGLLDGEAPSLIRYVFADPRAGIAFPDWDKVADEQAAALNYEAGADDPYAVELIEELSFAVGAAFTSRLAGPPVPPRLEPVQRMAHPRAGELRLAREALDLSAGDQRIMVYLPADTATAGALDRLIGCRPGALRAVSA
ncbi:helix-turn-helix transcriptional regulator [Nonomuraea antimicrobica]|uniref:Helix-turn-helix transcriptional regulator n=1 Tax=Nonomuraea antimicrobica TaxID=561173 RepID=A0ABP7B8I8_9ACTN